MARPYTKKERELKVQAFLEVLNDTKMITVACDKAGITRKTLEKWRKDLPPEELEDKINAIKESTKEWVEGCLLQQIANGSTAATCFFLKCHGWREQPRQVEVSTPETINVKAAIEEIRQTLSKPEDKNETKSDE